MNRSMSRGDGSNNPGRRRVVFPRHVKNALFRAQKGRCSYCGRTHRIRYLEIDHKFPSSRGGGNQIDNLQLLCTPCNMRKGIQSDQEFRRRYHRLLPRDGSIPVSPIPQEEFSDETQRTRRPKRCVPSTTSDSPSTERANGAVAVSSRPPRFLPFLLWRCSLSRIDAPALSNATEARCQGFEVRPGVATEPSHPPPGEGVVRSAAPQGVLGVSIAWLWGSARRRAAGGWAGAGALR